ncbi:MAG: flagellar protein FlaG [Magnetococcales bacterium]|nr:flagellar protein FlaG [Magnetococcales bacterium]
MIEAVNAGSSERFSGTPWAATASVASPRPDGVQTDAIRRLGFNGEKSARMTAPQFQLDQESHKLIVRVVDKNTEEVVRQFPSEEMVAMARRMRALSGELYG